MRLSILSLFALILLEFLVADARAQQQTNARKNVAVSFSEDLLLSFLSISSKVDNEIQRKVSKIKAATETEAINACDLALKQVLGDDYSCKNRFYVLNKKDFGTTELLCSLNLVSVSTRKNRGSLGTPVRAVPSFWKEADLKAYLEHPIILFDSITLDVSRIIKSSDSLWLKTSQQKQILPRKDGKIRLTRDSFLGTSAPEEFRLSSSSGRISVSGTCVIVSEAQKQEIIAFAKVLFANGLLSAKEKSQFVAAYSSGLINLPIHDESGLFDWLSEQGYTL